MKIPPVVIEQLTGLLPRLLELSGGEARPEHPGAFCMQWFDEEKSGLYWGGLPDHRNRPALVFAIYAVRQMNAGNQAIAAALLREAVGLLSASR